MRPFAWPPVLLALLLVAGGCQPLNEKHSFSMRMADVKQLDVPAPRYNQQVSVTVTPTGGPVSAYLVKTSEAERLNTMLDGGKPPPEGSVFAGKESKDQPEEYTLLASIPANTPYSLVLRTHSKGAEVKIKLVGR
jgi:hypothetical protein